MKGHGSSTLFLTSIVVFWLCLEFVVEGQSVNVRITGNVFPPEGMHSLPPGTEVSLNNGWGYAQSRLVTSGTFEFPGVPTGRYTLAVRANGFRSTEQTIDVEFGTAGWFHVSIRLGSPLAGEDSPPAGASTVPVAALRVPKAARREFDKGRGDYLKGRLDSALHHFQAASSICPDWPQPHAAHGLVLVDLKRAAQAETELRRATLLDPQWYVPWKHLGYLFLNTGRLEEALEHLDRAREICPADALTRTFRGEVLYQMGRQAEAADAFKEALTLNRSDVHAGYRLGFVLLQLGKQREALAAFENFLRRHRGADPGEVKQLVAKLRTSDDSQLQRD